MAIFIKKSLSKIVISIYIKLFKWYGSHVLKCRAFHAAAMSLKAYVYTFNIFPNELLANNLLISNYVTNKLLDLPHSENGKPVDFEKVNILESKVMTDDWFKKTLANYYLLTEYYYSFGGNPNLYSNEIADAREKASEFHADIFPITTKSFPEIKSNIKKNIKRLQTNIKELNSRRIQSEKLKRINPIALTQSHVLFIASVISILFLVSGFVYSKTFFWILGVSVGDFFSVSDYVSSSVDVVLSTTIASLAGIIYFIWGLSDDLSSDIHSELFNLNKNKKDIATPIIVTLMSTYVALYSYFTGKIDYIFISFLAFFVFVYFFTRFPALNYVKNRTAVGMVGISLFIFLMHLWVTIMHKVDELRSGEYAGGYAIEYSDDYAKYQNHELISSNSNFAFLWDNGAKRLTVIPRSSIVAYHPRRNN